VRHHIPSLFQRLISPDYDERRRASVIRTAAFVNPTLRIVIVRLAFVERKAAFVIRRLAFVILTLEIVNPRLRIVILWSAFVNPTLRIINPKRRIVNPRCGIIIRSRDDNVCSLAGNIRKAALRLCHGEPYGCLVMTILVTTYVK
jgi:hypothetical protein